MNRHLQELLKIDLPKFSVGNVVMTPFGMGIVTDTPSLSFDGLRINGVKPENYQVYFGMDDKVNQEFIDRNPLKYNASRFISQSFAETELMGVYSEQLESLVDWINNNWLIPTTDGGWRLETENIEFENSLKLDDVTVILSSEELVQLFLTSLSKD